MRLFDDLKIALPLLFLAIVGNLANLTLFNSISFLFGSVFALMALKLLGPRSAVAIGAIGASSTLFMWGHPWAAITFTLEVMFIAKLARKHDNLALFATLYWVLIGFALVVLTYSGALGLSLGTAAFIGLKQSLNGIFNAVVAGLALSVLRAIAPGLRDRLAPVSINTLLFNMTACVAILSAAVVVIAESRTSYSQTLNRLTVVMTTVGDWAAARIETDPQVHDLHDALQRELGALFTFRDGAFGVDTDVAIALVDASGASRDIMGTTRSSGTEGRVVDRAGALDRWEPTGQMAAMQRSRDSRYVLSVPVADVDGVSAIRVEFSAGPLIDMLERAGRTNLLYLCVTAALGLALSYWLISWLTAPLGRLAETSNSITDAIIAKKPLRGCPPSGVSEYNVLSKTLVDMSKSLISAFSQAEDVAASLEERVRSRTAQLDLMSQVAKQTDNMVIVTDTKGKVTWVNDAFERVTGYRLDEVMGKIPGHVLQQQPPSPELADHMRTCIARGEGFHVELLNHTKDGRGYWIEIRCSPFHDAAGHHQGFIAIELDITERRRANDQLRQSAQHTAAILDNVIDAIIAIDSAGKITSYNRAAEQIFGYAGDEIIGRDINTLMSQTHAKRHGSFIRNYLVSGKRKVMGRISEFTAVRRTGEEFPIELAVSEIVDGDQRFFIGIIRDITARTQMQAQLQQSQKLEAVGQLTGGIAHDFNNLLTVILGNAEALIEELEDETDEPLRVLAEMIATAADRGAQLTGRLLAFSRRQALKPELVDVNVLMSEMEPLLRRAIGAHIEITLKPAEDLWITQVDDSQLEAAILNLALNARDAMPGGGHLVIETANSLIDAAQASLGENVQPGDYVMLKISDTGTGMTPDVADRVFEPFFTTKEVGKGSGLGLSMVFGFVKQSGGYITLTSEPGKGTSLCLYFPRADKGVHRAPGAPHNAVLQRGSETILVVEDDPMVRANLTSQLSALGYVVHAAEDGPRALELLGERSDIDLLFTDMVMPGGLTGKDVADAARAANPDLRVLFTTGYTESSILNEGRLDRHVELLKKPYRRETLAAKLRKVLDEA